MSEMKLKNAVDKKQTTNEKWVEKNYIQSTPVSKRNCESTVYKNIK
jgi:hypothetical protein